MKFPNDLAEDLYAETPDEERGSSSEGIGWAGLYDLTGDEVTTWGAPYVVLVEHTDGFVDAFRCVDYKQAADILSQYAEV